MKLFDRLFKKKADDHEALENMLIWNQNMTTHLITLARLTFIKPEVLFRESTNIKANAEYILKLAELMRKGGSYENKGDNIQPKKRTA